MYTQSRRLYGIGLLCLLFGVLASTVPSARAENPIFQLDLEWWDHADPESRAHPDAPVNPLTQNRDGYELDRGSSGHGRRLAALAPAALSNVGDLVSTKFWS